MDKTPSANTVPLSGPDTDLQAPKGAAALLAKFDRANVFDELPNDEDSPARPVATVEPTTPPEEPEKPNVTETPAAEPAAAPVEGHVALTPTAPEATPLPELDSFKLSPQAKATTTAQFEGLKAAAKAREAALKTELEAVRKQLEEAKSAGTLSEDVRKELEELRAHRDATAVETDPVFEAKWGTPLATAENKTFAALKSAGADDALIDEIRNVAKQHGGLAAVDWDPILAAYPKARYSVLRHVADHSDAASERDRAAQEARANQQKWSETRKEALKTVIEGDTKQNEEALATMLDSFPVLKSEDPALKPVLQTVREKALSALRGESRAGLAAGFALSHYWKAVADSAQAKLLAAEKNQPAALAEAKKQIAALTTENATMAKELKAYRGATPRPRPQVTPVLPQNGGKASIVGAINRPVSELLNQHLGNNNQ